MLKLTNYFLWIVVHPVKTMESSQGKIEKFPVIIDENLLKEKKQKAINMKNQLIYKYTNSIVSKAYYSSMNNFLKNLRWDELVYKIQTNAIINSLNKVLKIKNLLKIKTPKIFDANEPYLNLIISPYECQLMINYQSIFSIGFYFPIDNIVIYINPTIKQKIFYQNNHQLNQTTILNDLTHILNFDFIKNNKNLFCLLNKVMEFIKEKNNIESWTLYNRKYYGIQFKNKSFFLCCNKKFQSNSKECLIYIDNLVNKYINLYEKYYDDLLSIQLELNEDYKTKIKEKSLVYQYVDYILVSKINSGITFPLNNMEITIESNINFSYSNNHFLQILFLSPQENYNVKQLLQNELINLQNNFQFHPLMLDIIQIIQLIINMMDHYNLKDSIKNNLLTLDYLSSLDFQKSIFSNMMDWFIVDLVKTKIQITYNICHHNIYKNRLFYLKKLKRKIHQLQLKNFIIYGGIISENSYKIINKFFIRKITYLQFLLEKKINNHLWKRRFFRIK